MSGGNNQSNAAIIGSVVAIAVSLIVVAVLNKSRQRPRVPAAAKSNDTKTDDHNAATQEASAAPTPLAQQHGQDPNEADRSGSTNVSVISSATIASLFETATAKVQSTPTLNNSQKLILYGLYKQATEGDAPPTTRLWNPVTRLKHEAWTKFQGKPPDVAKQIYVAFATMWIPDNSGNSSSSATALPLPADMDDFDSMLQMGAMDSEDEEGDEDVFGNAMGIRPSMPTREDDDDESDSDTEDTSRSTHHRPLHAAARNGDADQLRELILSQYSNTNKDSNTTGQTFHIDDRDKSGQTALHLAADHGHDECVQLLLQAGANPNAADLDGISVLQTAVIADHVSTAALLLQAGAYPDQPDADGDTPRSCCNDGSSTPEMQKLFSTSA